MWYASTGRLPQLPTCPLSVASANVYPSVLFVTLESSLTTVRRHNACAQNRVALFRCLPSAYTSFASVCHHDCFRSLVVSLIHLRLDHGNFVLVGLPAYLQRHLQSVLNAAARLVFRLRRYDHITDALATLHWLLLPELQNRSHDV